MTIVWSRMIWWRLIRHGVWVRHSQAACHQAKEHDKQKFHGWSFVDEWRLGIEDGTIYSWLRHRNGSCNQRLALVSPPRYYNYLRVPPTVRSKSRTLNILTTDLSCQEHDGLFKVLHEPAFQFVILKQSYLDDDHRKISDIHSRRSCP